MRKVWTLALALLLLVGLGSGVTAQQRKIVIYSALDSEVTTRVVNAFTQRTGIATEVLTLAAAGTLARINEPRKKLERREEIRAGHALRAVRHAEVAAVLPFEQAVDAAHFLLLAQAHAVLGDLRTALSVHARRIRPPVERTLVGVATFALQEELRVLAPTELADRTDVTCHAKTVSSVGLAF